MEVVRLFDLFKSYDQNDQTPERNWLNHFRMHGTSAAVHHLVQFFVDLIQGDSLTTIPRGINTSDGYSQFFDTESEHFQKYVDFKEDPPLLGNFFEFIISNTNNRNALFQQEWLANAVDLLNIMSNKEVSPTIQVFAGNCCCYVLEYIGKERKKQDDLDAGAHASFVALCSRLCSAIFKVYEMCLTSTSYSDLSISFLIRFISETKKNSTLMCVENIPFYQLALQVKCALMTVKIVSLMWNVLTSERSTDDQKKFMLRVGTSIEKELSYHITRQERPLVIRNCLKLAVEMHKITNDGFTGFNYDHIYQNLYNNDIQIRRLAAQLFMNASDIMDPQKRLDDVIRYHFKFEVMLISISLATPNLNCLIKTLHNPTLRFKLATRTADNWLQLIDAFEQYENFFDWVSLFQMLDKYCNEGQEANACHVAVAICNVANYQIKKWKDTELDEIVVIENLEPVFKLLASKLNTMFGTLHSKVFNSLLQIFDVVNVTYFMQNSRLQTEFTDMLKSFTETFSTTSNYNLAIRLCQTLRRIEISDPQAINLNTMLIQICNHFILSWENQEDKFQNGPTMRLLVLLQNISDLGPINLKEMRKILFACRIAFDQIKSADNHNHRLQAFVVNTYALTLVHLKVKAKVCDKEKDPLSDRFADDILSLFEWLNFKLNMNVNATFYEYMLFRAICVLASYRSLLALDFDTIEWINNLLDFLVKFIKKANNFQSKNQARIMILALAEAYTNDVPLPYELFIVLNENNYFDDQFNEFIKALLPKNSDNRNLFYRTVATAIHRMADRKNPNISALVKRMMAIVAENIPAIVDQQYLYTNVMVWVFRLIADFASFQSNGQKPTYNALTHLIPLFERIKENPELARKIQKSIPIPSDLASLDENVTNDLKKFYLLTETGSVV